MKCRFGFSKEEENASSSTVCKLKERIEHLHYEMFVGLSGLLHPNMDSWGSFKNMLHPYIPKAEVKGVESMNDAGLKLTEKGKIKYGQYEVMNNIFKTIKHQECLQLVEKYTDMIQHHQKEKKLQDKGKVSFHDITMLLFYWNPL